MHENRSYLRDAGSGAIVNSDHSGLQAYKKQRAHTLQQQQTISSLSDDIEHVKNEMTAIKELLVKILDK